MYALLQFLKLCAYIGFPISEGKTFLPRTSIDSVGITLDSCSMDAKLPGDKVSKCLYLLMEILGKKSCRLRELQQLL